ncbi:MAG TPA: phosphatase PAP2 family protein [Candidatus Tumulicola sp.]|jgi:undecaprenyl-diphosphatase
MKRRGNYVLVAVIALFAYWALGANVRTGGEPPGLLVFEAQLAGRGVLAAWWLTWTCYVQALVVIGIVLLVLAWRLPAWRGRILFSLASAIVCWRVADFFQHVFERARPFHWFVKHETAFSYPSSHAAIALGFYGLWAALLYFSELSARVRVLGAAALALLTLAIYWARLALGAHYLTDLIGGGLLAVGIVCLGLAAVPEKWVAPAAGRR